MIKYKIIRNKNINNKQIEDISRLKDSFWKYGLKSQKKFLKLNKKLNDLHILAYKEKKIIGYVNLKIKRLQKNSADKESQFFLFDGFIVDKSFRNMKIGQNLVEICKKKSRKRKMPILLLCKKSILTFYENFNFKKISKKKFFFINHQYKGILMHYNLKMKNINFLKITF
tara:strand:- start:184 stop:693 length:510 start_codon:yes stop_codon:yes gene_type:complete